MFLHKEKLMAKFLCKLVSSDNHHDDIILPHLLPVTIGRTPETEIKDSAVSRKQFELIANCDTAEVQVTHLGTNTASINKIPFKKNDVKKLREGDVLEVVKGKYPHNVTFTTAVDNVLLTEVRKRGHESSDEETTDRKKFKCDKSESDECEDDEMAAVKLKLERMKDTMSSSEPSTLVNKQPPIQSSGENSSNSNNASTPAVSSKWHEPDSKLYVYTSKGLQARSKIAGFDIDGTIICTKSGKVFPSHTGDWRILYSEIPGRLKKLHASGYKVVFFTNQKGIATGNVKIEEFKQKVQNIISKLGVPVQVFISAGSGKYRKPGLGMWKSLVTSYNDGISPDIKQCLYVGDAAGRPEKWAAGKKKDFSCSDRLFAINAEIKFYTPEEYFLSQKSASFNMPVFNPRNLDPNGPLLEPSSTALDSQSQEVIVMVGCPASGKSHFVKEYLTPKEYVHVNRDTLKTWQKCVEKTKLALGKNKSVVIDNTNPDVKSRKRYTDVAKNAGVQCRCFVMATTFEHSKHNERFREMTDNSHQRINDMIMNSYKSKYSYPQQIEGFKEVVKVNFVPKFEEQEKELLYKQYLLEK